MNNGEQVSDPGNGVNIRERQKWSASTCTPNWHFLLFENTPHETAHVHTDWNMLGFIRSSVLLLSQDFRFFLHFGIADCDAKSSVCIGQVQQPTLFWLNEISDQSFFVGFVLLVSVVVAVVVFNSHCLSHSFPPILTSHYCPQSN